jgi:hypothetical protein
MKTKSAQDVQFHIRMESGLYKKIIKANSAESLKTGIKKSTNSTMLELIEKGLNK